MGQDTVNITLDRDLWEDLRRVAAEQTLVLVHGDRISTIENLRIAIQVFLKLEPKEINTILKRP